MKCLSWWFLVYPSVEITARIISGGFCTFCGCSSFQQQRLGLLICRMSPAASTETTHPTAAEECRSLLKAGCRHSNNITSEERTAVLTDVPVQTSLKECNRPWSKWLKVNLKNRRSLKVCNISGQRIITGKTKNCKKSNNGGDTDEGSDDSWCLYWCGWYFGSASGQVLTVRRLQVEGTPTMNWWQ
jgi:hypothetical protein